MANFKSLMGEYFDCERNLDIAVSEILGLAINESNRTAKLTIKPYRKIEEQRIKALETELSRALSVNITVECDESRTGFHPQFMDVVLEILKSKVYVANGFFNNADYTLSGNELRIDLKKGGKDILLSVECDKEIEKIIRGIFGFECKVTLVQGEYDAETAVDMMQKKLTKNLAEFRQKLSSKREILTKIIIVPKFIIIIVITMHHLKTMILRVTLQLILNLKKMRISHLSSNMIRSNLFMAAQSDFHSYNNFVT